MVGEGWDWHMGAEMVTTTYFWALRRYKFGLAHTYFSHPDCVCADWFSQFTASQPFQCVIISIMNGWGRWRLEFILHNGHHTPAFESWVVARSAPVPYISHQDCVFSDWFKQMTASWPFQFLIISIMNGWRRLRLACGLSNGNHNVFFNHGWGQSCLACFPLLTPRFSKFGLIRKFHSISTLPTSQ